ncbi:hypothetical protein H1P_3640002 [Hyella patelloides LEGE 07179]|uniref:Uncharacterized protein n=1 Tax=Hyella patelloides LEGE 07179 TaxID=945734 RepID=A0A563VW97_9CYAN|nr:hypothetical protein H1P_3640002 [Hyella patelloides LEGE 07179]
MYKVQVKQKTKNKNHEKSTFGYCYRCHTTIIFRIQCDRSPD